MKDSRDTPRPVINTETKGTTTVAIPSPSRAVIRDWELNSVPAITPPGLLQAVSNHRTAPALAYFSAVPNDSILQTSEDAAEFPYRSPTVIYRDPSRARWSGTFTDPTYTDKDKENWWLNTAASRCTVLLPELNAAIIPMVHVESENVEIDSWGPKTARTLKQHWGNIAPSKKKPIGLYARIAETIGDARPVMVLVALAADGTITHAIISMIDPLANSPDLTARDVARAWHDVLATIGRNTLRRISSDWVDVHTTDFVDRNFITLCRGIYASLR